MDEGGDDEHALADDSQDQPQQVEQKTDNQPSSITAAFEEASPSAEAEADVEEDEDEEEDKEDSPKSAAGLEGAQEKERVDLDFSPEPRVSTPPIVAIVDEQEEAFPSASARVNSTSSDNHNGACADDSKVADPGTRDCGPRDLDKSADGAHADNTSPQQGSRDDVPHQEQEEVTAETAAASVQQGEETLEDAEAEHSHTLPDMEPEDTGTALGGSAMLPKVNIPDPPTTATASRAPPSEAERPVYGRDRIWKARHNKWQEQTDSDPAWYKHKRHVMIFSFSGKPVFSRYGAEEGLSSTTGALSAIVSKFASFFFASNGNGPDTLRYFVAGDHTFTFVEKGPLWLVCASRCGDSYPDTVQMLDRIHLQITTLLTGGIERTLKNRPNYDMRGIMGGTDSVVNSLIRWCTQDMFLHVEGLEPLPLAPAARHLALSCLHEAKVPNVLGGWLMAGHQIIALVNSRQVRLHPLDISMIINIIMSSTSLRTAESWTPVCLPHVDNMNFGYAYISFVEDTDVVMVFISQGHDSEQFYAISQKANAMKEALRSGGVLEDVAEALCRTPINFRMDEFSTGQRVGASASNQQGTTSQSMPTFGATRSFASHHGDRSRGMLLAPAPSPYALLEGIIHAAYVNPKTQQYFSSAIAPSYRTRKQVKSLFRNYGRCRMLLRNAKMPSQVCVATDHECFYVSLSVDYQMFLAVPRGISTGVISRFYNWIKLQEAHLFMTEQMHW